MVCERDESGTTVERLNTDLMALREEVSAQTTVQSELHDAEDASSRFNAQWKSAGKPAKATERHPVQVAQQSTWAQARVAHEKSS